MEKENVKTENKEASETWKELFKSSYDKTETWADAHTLLSSLFINELEEFVKTHETVKKLTGLDMRQDFYLSIAKSLLNFKKNKED